LQESYENKKIRFNELKRLINNISPQVLARKLDEMRKDGFGC
jgi:DNA-binding HxlR family transcriptional regulator